MEFNLTAQELVEDFTEPFSEGRYPYTYACDFIRAHQSLVQEKLKVHFGYIESRAEASQFMKFLNNDSYEYEHIATVFADAYMLEHGIVKDS